jgi:excinuclease ABC subunit C
MRPHGGASPTDPLTTARRRNVAFAVYNIATMNRVPNNRRAAAALIRSTEGMHPHAAVDQTVPKIPNIVNDETPAAPPPDDPGEATLAMPDSSDEASTGTTSEPALPPRDRETIVDEPPASTDLATAADVLSPPPDRDDFGPRYGSLVAYPGDPPAIVERKPKRGRPSAGIRRQRQTGLIDLGNPAEGAYRKVDREAPRANAADGAVAELELAGDDDPVIALSDDELTRKLDAIPTDPGVYLLRDRNGKVLYIGKAKSLRPRVRSYFREGGDGRFQVRFLMRQVRDFETLVARSEKEALILENNLIKQYRPRYNIRLKDDKSYLSAKVTNHPWPRITVTRRIVKDGGRYFGPFGSADGLRETIDVIRKVFPLRTCSDTVFRNRSRPCIEYQIKRCLGPCVLQVDRAEYERHLHAAQLLLEGKNLELLRELRERMKGYADRLEFEEAARVRDSVRAIEKTVERQTVLHHWGGDQDVFGLYREGGFIEAIVLLVRNGKLTSTRGWSFHDLEFADEDVLADLLTQYYAGARFIPDEVILPVVLEDADVRADLLTERRSKKVDVFVPQRGDKLRLLEMAMENARQSFTSRRDNEGTREKMLDELRAKLHLRNLPKRIECYDISNLQGSMVVGSQATFDDGEPQKALYRRYRIRTVEGQDDFASLYEVLTRRLKRTQEEKVYPDLWVIDGGKGQLNVAIQVLKEFNLSDQIEVVSLAKQHVLNDVRDRAVTKSEERVFLPNRKDPIILPRNSTALFVLVRIRDEAHRFAITYNRDLRRRARLRSVLDDIEGIGPVRRRELLRHFGSLRRIREASLPQLAAVKGVNAELAAEIRKHLDMMSALLDQEENVEREEDRVAAEYLDAGNGQLQLLSRKPRAPVIEPAPLSELGAPIDEASAKSSDESSLIGESAPSTNTVDRGS